MPLTFFTCVADFSAIVTRSSLEENPDPFRQAISGLATFTPTAPETRTAFSNAVQRNRGSDLEVRSELDQTTYVLRPMLHRIVDGVLMNVRGAVLDPEAGAEIPEEEHLGHVPRRNHLAYGVRLVANTDALGPLKALSYRVTFSRVVYDKGDRRLASFSFDAPDSDTVVDLATVHRRKPDDK